MQSITAGFAIFTSLCSYAALSNAQRILEFTSELRELNPQREFAVNETVLYSIAFILFAGILVSLKFMWDIRHPKPD